VRNNILLSFFSSLFSSFPIPPHIHFYNQSREVNMITGIFLKKALLADTISTMTTEELRNIIMHAPDKDLEVVGAAVLAEKRRMGTQIIHLPDSGDDGARSGSRVSGGICELFMGFCV
jgi:hypothetical protein